MNAVNQVLNGIDKVFGVIEKYITAFALIVFTVVIFCNVVGRYVLLNSIPWAEELSRYLNIFLVYIALSAGIKTDAHIGVDAVETLLAPKQFHKYCELYRCTGWCGAETLSGLCFLMEYGLLQRGLCRRRCCPPWPHSPTSCGPALWLLWPHRQHTRQRWQGRCDRAFCSRGNFVSLRFFGIN